jgi:hypothetical protein
MSNSRPALFRLMEKDNNLAYRVILWYNMINTIEASFMIERMRGWIEKNIKVLSTIGIIIISIFAFIGVGSIIMFIIGYRPIITDTEIKPDWDAFTAITGVTIPIVAVFLSVWLTNRIQSSKKDIGESNSNLLNELNKYSEKLKILTKLVDERGNIVIDGGNFTDISEEDLKNKALKFVNIAMITNTKRVAEHLGVSDEKAFEILKELVLHDGSISCGGQLNKERMYNIVWTKKRKS